MPPFFAFKIRHFFLILVAILALWLLWPRSMPASPTEVEIVQGSGAEKIAQSVADAGIAVSPTLLAYALRATFMVNKVKAGVYAIDEGSNVLQIIKKLLFGKFKPLTVRFIEGWNIRQFRASLDKNSELQHETTGLDDAAFSALLGLDGHPEGRFFPDTYSFSRGTTDSKILKQAAAQMDKQLNAAWEDRAPDLPYQNPYEALIMASIIEKETGAAKDRAKIAAVFVNRLRLGMPLQTDPTVIYGLGAAFDGDIKREHLRTDTPYNTYTRKGLPPSPISAPGKESLNAAMHPAKTQDLYFVARGDGSSQFSQNLDDHNAAVRKYILRNKSKNAGKSNE